MTGLECQIENCYHRNQPEDAIPLKFAEIVRVVKRPGGKRTYAEGCFWPRIDILNGWSTEVLPSTYGEHREHLNYFAYQGSMEQSKDRWPEGSTQVKGHLRHPHTTSTGLPHKGACAF